MQISVTRGPVVESVHRVDAVVSRPDGAVLTWGDAVRPTVARSGLKLVQALALVRSGAADRYGLGGDELALACASHSAEPGHLEAVSAWLERLGLDQSVLECGPAQPSGDLLRDHLAAGRGPEPIANNCSGKHTGFVTVARHLGIDPAGYIEPDHPVQGLVTEAIVELSGVDLGGQEPGRDGCGIPTWSLPLDVLAATMARLVDRRGLEPSWAAAAERVVEAVQPRPWWISGRGRHEVEVAGAATEAVVLKAGAEGVFMGSLPERGLGIAVKAADGAARAAQVGVSAVLAHLGVLAVEAVAQPVHNAAGLVVGQVRAEPEEPVVLDRPW